MAEKNENSAESPTKEPNSSSNSTSNWLWNSSSSWLNIAKNKSTEVLSFVKKDLEELSTVVKSEATTIVNNTANVLEKTLKLDDNESTSSSIKRSFSSFLGQMNEVLNPKPDDSGTETLIVTDDKYQKALYELQNDPNTFLIDPEENLFSQYESWLELISDQLTNEERLAKQLVKHPKLNDQYIKLCPDQVTHDQFWKRYLFKKAFLEDKLANEKLIEKRKQLEQVMGNDDTLVIDQDNLKNDNDKIEKTEKIEIQNEPPLVVNDVENNEEILKWEATNNLDYVSNIELTEEEQTKLLEQYENEMRAQKQLTNNKNDKRKTKNETGKKSKNKPSKVSDDVQTKEPDNLAAELEKANKSSSTTSTDAKSSGSSSLEDSEWEKV